MLEYAPHGQLLTHADSSTSMENGDQPSSNVLAALIRLLRRKIEAVVKLLWFTLSTVKATALVLLQLKQFDFAAFLAIFAVLVSNCSPFP